VSVLVIAHRGASADALENTLEAFDLAIAQGADMIETDLHLLRDGAIALYHDDAIGRVPLGRLTLDELREHRPRVPTLEEALDACGERIAFNLEIKCPKAGAYPGLEARVLEELRRRGLLARTLFSCFDDDVLATLRSLDPSARIGLLASARTSGRLVERAGRLRAEAIHLNASIATPRRIAALHGAGFRVYVYTVDDPGEQDALLRRGVDGLFTNRPGPLVAFLRHAQGAPRRAQ
jgi:glycerophosphoryl diester phosphodiesterase